MTPGMICEVYLKSLKRGIIKGKYEGIFQGEYRIDGKYFPLSRYRLIPLYRQTLETQLKALLTGKRCDKKLLLTLLKKKF